MEPGSDRAVQNVVCRLFFSPGLRDLVISTTNQPIFYLPQKKIKIKPQAS